MPATSDDRATVAPGPGTPPAETETGERSADLVESDLLVEDVSIDGMCGVY